MSLLPPPLEAIYPDPEPAFRASLASKRPPGYVYCRNSSRERAVSLIEGEVFDCVEVDTGI